MALVSRTVWLCVSRTVWLSVSHTVCHCKVQCFSHCLSMKGSCFSHCLSLYSSVFLTLFVTVWLSVSHTVTVWLHAHHTAFIIVNVSAFLTMLMSRQCSMLARQLILSIRHHSILGLSYPVNKMFTNYTIMLV